MIAYDLLRHRGASSAAEFALVLPLLILLLFGVIDGGRWLWEYNRVEKATQMGARLAVVTEPVSASINTNYSGLTCGGTTLSQGDLIPGSCFTTISCAKPSNTVMCTSGTANTAAFDRIVSRMQLFANDISASNVKVEYLPSATGTNPGLGFAGNPSGPDVSPIVRVSVGDPTRMTFQPISFYTFKQTGISMPVFRASLTGEDMAGAQSN